MKHRYYIPKLMFPLLIDYSGEEYMSMHKDEEDEFNLETYYESQIESVAELLSSQHVIYVETIIRPVPGMEEVTMKSALKGLENLRYKHFIDYAYWVDMRGVSEKWTPDLSGKYSLGVTCSCPNPDQEVIDLDVVAKLMNRLPENSNILVNKDLKEGEVLKKLDEDEDMQPYGVKEVPMGVITDLSEITDSSEQARENTFQSLLNFITVSDRRRQGYQHIFEDNKMIGKI